ncbi:MAG: DUF4363 family protein [Oscillospiraceae bacterium]|nr:DUF4363 family protein [Oscillospiraceae bacterium]
MMRWIPAGIILLTLIIFVFWFGQRVAGETDSMRSILGKSIEAVRAGDWESADNEIKKLVKLWSSAEKFYRITMDQIRVDPAGGCISRLETAVYDKNAADFILDGALLEGYLYELGKGECLLWETIL